MHAAAQLNFHHDTKPVPLRSSYSGLVYDPVKTDQVLTRILLGQEEEYENPRSTRATRR